MSPSPVEVWSGNSKALPCCSLASSPRLPLHPPPSFTLRPRPPPRPPPNCNTTITPPSSHPHHHPAYLGNSAEIAHPMPMPTHSPPTSCRPRASQPGNRHMAVKQMLLFCIGLLVFLLASLPADAVDEHSNFDVLEPQHTTGKSVRAQPLYTVTLSCSCWQRVLLVGPVGAYNSMDPVVLKSIRHSRSPVHPVRLVFYCPVAPLPKPKHSISTALPTSSTPPSTSPTRKPTPHNPYLLHPSRPPSTHPSHHSPPCHVSLPCIIDTPQPLYHPCLTTPPIPLSPPPLSLTPPPPLYDRYVCEIAAAAGGGRRAGVPRLWVEHLGHAIGLGSLWHLRSRIVSLALYVSHRDAYASSIYVWPTRFPRLSVRVTFHHGGIPWTAGGSGNSLGSEPSGTSEDAMADPLLKFVGSALMLDGSFDAKHGCSPVVSAPSKVTPNSEKLSLAMVLFVIMAMALLVALLAWICIILGDDRLVLPGIVSFVDVPRSTTNEILLFLTLLAAPVLALRAEIAAAHIAANLEMAVQISGQWPHDVPSSTGISSVNIGFVGAWNPYKAVASAKPEGVPIQASYKKVSGSCNSFIATLLEVGIAPKIRDMLAISQKTSIVSVPPSYLVVNVLATNPAMAVQRPHDVLIYVLCPGSLGPGATVI